MVRSVPGPSTAASVSSITVEGKVITASTTRMTTRSSQPPTWPAQAPSTVPMSRATATLHRPTISDT